MNTDIMSVVLNKSTFPNISSQELAEQIESKKKCKNKLPSWFNSENIYYPNKRNIEQCSSEITARYKAQIVRGKSLIDLTGGLGVDCFFFSKKIERVIHCEIDEQLSQIAAYNFEVLDAKNIEVTAANGFDFLAQYEDSLDWIFVDPSRRNVAKGKVFQLSDCLPNIPENLELLFEKSQNILLKTSPLLDFTVGIKELKFVKEIHVVAVNNEVKELLWILTKSLSEGISIKSINFTKTGEETFNFRLSDEKDAISSFSPPQKYLYEPNTAILKSGAFKLLGERLQLKKLHEHTHLYTSNALIDFPGRRFAIENSYPYNKKTDKNLNVPSANVTVRNFPESVATIRTKLKIKDGGETYLFFTRDINEKKIVLKCAKVKRLL